MGLKVISAAVAVLALMACSFHAASGKAVAGKAEGQSVESTTPSSDASTITPDPASMDAYIDAMFEGLQIIIEAEGLNHVELPDEYMELDISPLGKVTVNTSDAFVDGLVNIQRGGHVVINSTTEEEETIIVVEMPVSIGEGQLDAGSSLYVHHWASVNTTVNVTVKEPLVFVKLSLCVHPGCSPVLEVLDMDLGKIDVDIVDGSDILGWIEEQIVNVVQDIFQKELTDMLEEILLPEIQKLLDDFKPFDN